MPAGRRRGEVRRRGSRAGSPPPFRTPLPAPAPRTGGRLTRGPSSANLCGGSLRHAPPAAAGPRHLPNGETDDPQALLRRLARAGELPGGLSGDRRGAGRRPQPRRRAVRARRGAEGLRITHVTETHIHADFVSGSRELARPHGRAAATCRTRATRTGSTPSPRGRRRGAAAGRRRFLVGNIRIDVMQTPGHTPEHLAFLVTDTAGADRPMGVFTGDFIFVGDVGAPTCWSGPPARGHDGGGRARTLPLAAALHALPD